MADAMGLIESLKINNITTQVYINSIERVINNYVSYYYYAPEQAMELFDLIIKNSQLPKDEYYRFVLINAEYFSESQIEFIKIDLERFIKKSDYQFYDIVSMYHLNEYKKLIASEVDSAYFSKLRTAFGSNYVSIGLMEKARPIITLANLGEVALQDSIINIVSEFHLKCLTEENNVARKFYYVDLYFGVVPKILGKLNSKRSVELSAHLMLDDYEVYLDGVQTSVYELYLNSVVTPKVNGYDYSSILMTMFDYEDIDLIKKRAFVNNLINRINNREIDWKKTLNDVDK